MVEAIKFRHVDNDGNGRLEEINIINNLAQITQATRWEFIDATQDAFKKQIAIAMRKIDELDTDRDGSISGTAAVFGAPLGDSEYAKAYDYLGYINNFEWGFFGGKIGDFFNAADTSSMPMHYSVSVAKVQEKVRDVLKELIEDKNFADNAKTNFGIAHHINDDLTADIRRALPSREEFTKSLATSYIGKTISDVYENSQNYPGITVSQEEYERWKIFYPAVGDDLELNIYNGEKLGNSGGDKSADPTTKSNGDAISSVPHDNLELKKFIDFYGLNGKLDGEQKTKLKNETTLWFDDENQNYETRKVNDADFRWLGPEKYNFYNLYDEYFKYKGLY